MYLFTINWLLAILAIFIVSGFIILLYLDNVRRIALFIRWCKNTTFSWNIQAFREKNRTKMLDFKPF